MTQTHTAATTPRDAVRCGTNHAPYPIGDIGIPDAAGVIAMRAITGAR